MNFGEKLKSARTKAMLTQEEVAGKIGISRQTMSNWENNRSYPDLGSVLKLSDLYGLSLDDMLKDDMALRRQLQQRREDIQKYCSWVMDLGLLFFPFACLLMLFDSYSAAVALALLGMVLYAGALLSLSWKLGLPWKWTVLMTASVALWLVGALWRFSDPGNGPGMTLLLLGMFANHYAARKMAEDANYTRRSTALTGFVAAVVLLCALIPPMHDSMVRGSFNEYDPFTNADYRVVEVLAGEEEVLPRIHLTSNYAYLEYPGQERISLGGKFTYIPQPEGAAQKGVWEMIPEEDPSLRYRITVVAEEEIIFSCLDGGEPRWSYQIALTPLLGCTIRDVLGTTIWSADWYETGTFVHQQEDMSRYPALRGKGTIKISVPGEETTIIVQEEYHRGEAVQHRSFELEKDGRGFVQWKLQAEDTDETQYAIYRIPYGNGEFVMALQLVP